MQENNNLLIDSLPSRAVFVVLFAVLFVAAYFGALAVAGAKFEGGLDMVRKAPMGVPFVLLFVTIYAFVAGILLGILQKKAVRIFLGAVSGPFGAWINWPGIAMIFTVFVAYCLWLLALSIVGGGAPPWTLFSDSKAMWQGLGFENAFSIIWYAGLGLGVIFLVGYVRTRYEGLIPVIKKRTTLIALALVCVLAVLWAVTAPCLKIKDTVNTLPGRFISEYAEDIDARFGLNITGSGAGQWTVSVKDLAMKLEEGLVNPTVTVTVTSSDWAKVMLGKQTLSGLTFGDKITIEGDDEPVTYFSDMYEPYKIPVSRAFQVIFTILAILFLATFSIAPLICIYDCLYFSLKVGSNPIEPEEILEL